jgi:hypothetical protein
LSRWKYLSSFSGYCLPSITNGFGFILTGTAVSTANGSKSCMAAAVSVFPACH